MDPIGTNGGLNLYGYCGGDPVNRSDPMGTRWDWVTDANEENGGHYVWVDSHTGSAALDFFVNVLGFYPSKPTSPPAGFVPGSGGVSPGGAGLPIGMGLASGGTNMAPGEVAGFVHGQVNPVVKTEMALATLPASVVSPLPAVGALIGFGGAVLHGQDPLEGATFGSMTAIAAAPASGISGFRLFLSGTGTFFGVRGGINDIESGNYGGAAFNFGLGGASAYYGSGDTKIFFGENPRFNPLNYQVTSEGFGANFGNARIRYVAPPSSGLTIVNRAGMEFETVTDVKGRPVKIYGQSSSSSTTPGHDTTMLEYARALAKTGDYEYLTLQRSWRTATGRVGTSRAIPDVIGVQRTGVVDAWEVESLTDNQQALRSRLQTGQSSLPLQRQGTIDIIQPSN